MIDYLKCAIRSIQYSLYSKDSIKVDWVRQNNFGDVLNPVLIELLTKKNPKHVVAKFYNHNTYYSVIGSILGRAKENTIVWGSGYISNEDHVKATPRKICAVRGPRTRALLLNQGIQCPEVYGDPALLMPRLYNPSLQKKYKLGVVPHYVDKECDWIKSVGRSDVKILDIHTKDPLNFISQMLECEKIISSSLHGIIIADAYQIPNAWVEFSNKVTGDGFKFFDYFDSISRDTKKSIYVDKSISVASLEAMCSIYEVKLELQKLLDSAPFDINHEI